MEFLSKLLVASVATLLFAGCTSNQKSTSQTTEALEVTVRAAFENDRIHLLPKFDGKTLKMFLDSGGGSKPFTYSDVVVTFKLPLIEHHQLRKGVVGLTDFTGAEAPFNQLFANFDAVPVYSPENQDSEAVFVRLFTGAAFVGGTFFGRERWVIDYPNRKLLIDRSQGKIEGKFIQAKFKSDASGKRPSNHPLIAVDVDGESLPVLFDTGATSWYSEDAKKKVGVSSEFPASCFIRKSVYLKWRKKNPNWKYIEKGDRFNGGQDLIEVPAVIIAGHTVGPIWFAARNDREYDHFGKESFDARIDGAVGGSVLKHFRIIADYETGQFFFQK